MVGKAGVWVATVETCPACGSDEIELWIGGPEFATAKAWVAAVSRAWYHCRECNYPGPLGSGRGPSTEMHHN
jgi:hypothetical protein